MKKKGEREGIKLISSTFNFVLILYEFLDQKIKTGGLISDIFWFLEFLIHVFCEDVDRTRGHVKVLLLRYLIGVFKRLSVSIKGAMQIFHVKFFC